MPVFGLLTVDHSPTENLTSSNRPQIGRRVHDLERLPFIPGAPAVPVVATDGVHLVLGDGSQVIDAGGGANAVNIGHGRAEVVDAAAKAMSAISYVVPPFATDARLELMSRLVDRWLPDGLDRVFFTSGGSESVDAALRLARLHHVASGRDTRWKVVGLRPSYHGVTLSTLAVGGHLPRRTGLEPLLSAFPSVAAHRATQCPRSAHGEDCAAEYADLVERVIVAEGAETVSAVIVEPVIGSSGGALVHPPGYLRRLRDICTRHGVLLIADEVLTGFGRTGRRFAIEHDGATPDILVGGKGLAGGYLPIGGVYTSTALVTPLANAGLDLMFFTYSSHHTACAVAAKVLEIIEREDLVERSEQMGQRLLDRVRPLEAHPHVREVRGVGLLVGVELVRDKVTGEQFPAEAKAAMAVTRAGLGAGAFFYPGGAGDPRDVVMLSPPFTVDDDDIEQIAAALEKSLDVALLPLADAR